MVISSAKTELAQRRKTSFALKTHVVECDCANKQYPQRCPESHSTGHKADERNVVGCPKLLKHSRVHDSWGCMICWSREEIVWEDESVDIKQW